MDTKMYLEILQKIYEPTRESDKVVVSDQGYLLFV